MSTTDLPGPSLLAGRYRLVERLGSGGMSVVWRGFDEVLGRQIAVKVLPPSVSADPSFRRRLRAEAQAAARLSHPHITNVYDYGEAVTSDGEPVPFVVMEMVDGESLAGVLARMYELPWNEAVRICAQVSAALAAAHSRGIVHRDVTPANVMLTASGAKVVDFGISALIGESDIDPDGSLLGTPAYLAPERLEGGQVSPASDVYAVGLLLYRALIGQLPWDVGTTTALLRAHQYTEPEPLPVVEGMPFAVNELVARCLAKQPGERPTSAELAAVLTEIGSSASHNTPSWVDYGEDTTILPSRAEFLRGTREGVRASVAVPDGHSPHELHAPRSEFVAAAAMAGVGSDADDQDSRPILRTAKPTSAHGDDLPSHASAEQSPYASPSPYADASAGQSPYAAEPSGQSPYAPGAPVMTAVNSAPRNTRFRPAPREAAHAPTPLDGQQQFTDESAYMRPDADRPHPQTPDAGPAGPGSAGSGSAGSGAAGVGPGATAGGTTADAANDPARRGQPVARIRPSAGQTRPGHYDQQPFVPAQRVGRTADQHQRLAAGALPRAPRRPSDSAALVRGRRMSIVLGAILAVGASSYGWNVLGNAGTRNQAAPQIGSAAARRCVVTYGIRSQHNSSFIAALTLTNRSSVRVEDWVLRFILPGDQTITGGGGGVLSQEGRDVTVTSDSVINPDRTVVLSLAGTYRTDNRVPVAFELQGATCDVYVSSAPGESPKQVTQTPEGVRLVAPAPGVPVPGLSSGPAGFVPVGVDSSALPRITPTTSRAPGKVLAGNPDPSASSALPAPSKPPLPGAESPPPPPPPPPPNASPTPASPAPTTPPTTPPTSPAKIPPPSITEEPDDD